MESSVHPSLELEASANVATRALLAIVLGAGWYGPATALAAPENAGPKPDTSTGLPATPT